MRIFNLKQADVFIRKGAKVIGVGTGNRYKVYIEFDEDMMFKELLSKWLNHEI